MKKTDINKELRFQPDTELLELAAWFSMYCKKTPSRTLHFKKLRIFNKIF